MRRGLTLLDVLCIGINAIVGSGVFALPDDMQREMGGWSPLSYLACALLLLPVALCFAELGARYDENGGAYVYAREAFGRVPGFLIGWVCWVSTFVSWAANTVFFVEILGVDGVARQALIAASILALGTVNYVGVRLGASVVNFLTFAKLAAIACFVASSIPGIDTAQLGGALPRGLQGVGQGMFLAVFPLQGFEVVPIPAGETRDPRRNVPIATVGSLVLAALLFAVVQACLVGSYPRIGEVSPDPARGLRGPLVDGAWHIGPVLGTIVLAGSVLSVAGFLAGSALGAPRYAQALAEGGFLPRALARIHPTFDTPHVAIVATTAITAVLALSYDFLKLVEMASLTVLLQYLATCLAVPVLRRKAPRGPQSWTVPGGALLPALGAAGCVLLILRSAAAEREFVAWAMLAGVAVAALGALAARR